MAKGDEEVLKGSVVWKIDNFLDTKIGYRKSTKFKFGRYNCCLCIPKCFYGFFVDGVKEVDLITVNSPTEAPMFRSKAFYKLSLIDRYGKEFLTTSGTILGESKNILMVLFMEYLEKYKSELLTDGSVTIRLSWNSIWNEASVRHQDTQTVPDLNSEEDPSNLLETLSNDLKCFYERQADTDCMLRAGEALFPVHRTILSARSTVFSAMFHHDTSESRTGEVDIPDVEATSMGHVLHYVYSGKIRGLSEDTAVPMYTLADKYALIELRDASLEFLMHNLTTENVCDVAVLAHAHAETELQDRVVEFIEERLDDFEESDNWIEFSKSRPSLAIKLLRSALKASKKDKIRNTSKQ